MRKEIKIGSLKPEGYKTVVAHVTPVTVPDMVSACQVSWDQIESERKAKLRLFNEIVAAYSALDREDLGLHFAATKRAIDQTARQPINPQRRLTGADRLAIARIALGTACAYIKLTGFGHTIAWDQLDETTKMQLTGFVMDLHRLYNDPTYQHVDAEVLGKLGIGGGEAHDIFIETCKHLIRVWLMKSDFEYVL